MKNFWGKVHKTKSCWLWTGYCCSKGYGRFGFRKKGWGAHRVSWVLHKGEIPEGAGVLHRCDNPGCVNPKHLFLGTPKDNAVDRDQKGRLKVRRGEAHGSSKLTERQVLAMQKLRPHTTYKQIAKAFKTPWQTVYDALSGKNWKHLRSSS